MPALEMERSAVPINYPILARWTERATAATLFLFRSF
jgi:hypothetical protein